METGPLGPFFIIELKNLIVEKTKLRFVEVEGLKRDRVHGVPPGEQAGAGNSPRWASILLCLQSIECEST